MFINVTPKAYEQIKNLVTDNNAMGIRVLCQTGGCAGYKYDMNIVHHPIEEDKVVPYEHFKIYIDKTSILKVIGSVIDYEENDLSEGFVIQNESNKSYCGCGKSFS